MPASLLAYNRGGTRLLKNWEKARLDLVYTEGSTLCSDKGDRWCAGHISNILGVENWENLGKLRVGTCAKF